MKSHKFLFIYLSFISFIFLNTLNAAIYQIDLSSSIAITPATQEVSTHFYPNISIKNERTGAISIDGDGATITFHTPTGSIYSGVYNTLPTGTHSTVATDKWHCDSAVDASGDLNCTYNGTLNNGEISNGLSVELTAPPTVSTGVNAKVIVQATTIDSNSSNDSNSTTVEFGKSNLHVTKTASSSLVTVGTPFTYTITANNPQRGSGNPTVKAKSVTITDTLPSGVSYVSGTLSDTSWCSIAGNTLTCSGQDIDVSNYQSVSFGATVATSGAKINNAIATTTTHDYNTNIKGSATVTTSAPTQSNVAVYQTLQSGITANSAYVNSRVNYHLTIKNLSSTTSATGVIFKDTLPPGVAYIRTNAASPISCNESGGVVQCTLNQPIVSSSSYYIDIIVKMPSTPGVINNTANVTSTSSDSDTSNNTNIFSVTVLPAKPDLKVYKDTKYEINSYSNNPYTIVLKNIGNASAYGATISDTIPTANGSTYVSGSLYTLDSNWSCSITSGVINCNTINPNLEIPSGYSSNIASYKVKAGHSIYRMDNTVTVNTATSESNTSNNTYISHTYVIDLDLEVTKRINGTYYPNEGKNYIGIAKNLNYDIYVRSKPLGHGSPSVPITDVNVTDLLPSNITAVSVIEGSRFLCNQSGSTLVCTMKNAMTTPLLVSDGYVLVATINSMSFSATDFNITDVTKNLIKNNYKAETSLTDYILTNNAPTTSTGHFLHTNTYVRGANMSIKNTAPSSVGMGANYSYTLDVANKPRYNSGYWVNVPSSDAQSIIVKDTLPIGVTYRGSSGTNWSCSQSGRVITCSYAPSMSSMSSSTLTLNVTAPLTSGSITNYATVTNSTPELIITTPDNNDSAVVNVLNNAVDLKISKTAFPYPNVGKSSDVKYTITVKNISTHALPSSGFTIIDKLPSGVIFKSVTSPVSLSCTTSGNNPTTITCRYPSSLAPGASVPMDINVTSPSSTGISFTNDANVTSSAYDANLSNNHASVTLTTIASDLSINKTARMDTHNPSMIHYNISVKDVGASATNIKVIDSFDSRLNLIALPSGSCTITGHTFTCALPNMTSGQEYNLTTIMLASNGSNIVNEANVTSSISDSNLTNNSSRVYLDINSTGTTGSIKLKTGFRKHMSMNNYSNTVAIGNSILKANNYSSGMSLVDINSSYVDIDSDSSTYNSSSADLNISESNITIEYAGLYWGGHIKAGDNNDSLTSNFNTIKLELPDGTIHTITGGNQEHGTFATDDNITGFYRFKKDSRAIARLYYGCEANVTSILRNLYNYNGAINGTYTISDLNVSYGLDNTPGYIPDPSSSTGWAYFNSGFFGGWELIVMYSVDHRTYRSVKYKSSTLFDGYQVLMPTFPGQAIGLSMPVSGFITPATGSIKSSLFSMVFAGDENLSYESMSIDNGGGVKHFVKEGLHNIDNIFNDTITLKNTNNVDIVKYPGLSYNPGIDLDEYNTTNYLSNSQTSTSINLEVNASNILVGGGYPAQNAFVSMLAFNTQIYTPDFIDSYKECFKKEDPLDPYNNNWVPCSSPTPLIHRGSILKYRITMINSGTDDAKNVHVKDVLPMEVDFNGTCSGGSTSDVNMTNIYTLPDGMAGGIYDSDNNYNSFLRTISNKCYAANYEMNQTTRDECRDDLKAILVDGNTTSPINTIPDGTPETMNLLDTSYNDVNCSIDSNGTTTLVFNQANFKKKSVAWVDFYTVVNQKARLGSSFDNSVLINFSSLTLIRAGLNNLQSQKTQPVNSGIVNFDWTHIAGVVRDPNRTSLGTKIVKKPFDLNISVSGINPLDINGSTSISISNLYFVDKYNSVDTNITSTVVNTDTNITATTLNWSTHNTSYSNASKEIGFKFDITVKFNNYVKTKRYPADFNASAPYAGDLFTTRPKNFTLSFPGGSTTTYLGETYQIVKAASSASLSVSAADNLNINSSDYNATLIKANGVDISLDNNFSTNPACININDLNISNLNFANGVANSPATKYAEVGVIKLNLKDNNWTSKDRTNNDCIPNSGTNTPNANHIIGCNVEGNSTSIVFTPDHFIYVDTNITDFDNNFTYMVPNPINDQMYAKVTTKLESLNADNNITQFFSSTCFASTTDVGFIYNAQSKQLGVININIANENNLSNINSKYGLNSINNSIFSDAKKGEFTSGIAPLVVRLAIDRNATATNPVLIDPQDLNASLNDYLGITNVSVSPKATSIVGVNKLHYLYGRVHAPDYRFAGNKGVARVYYEAYCKDCNQTYRNTMNILGGESTDYVDWYINSMHNQLQDGNVSRYSTIKDVKFGNNFATGLATTSSAAIANGIEFINVVADPNDLPYIDKVEINATNWLTSPPKNFILEFQNQQDKWAGRGKLGHFIDANISERSNRRLSW